MLETITAWASVIIFPSVFIAGIATWLYTIYQVLQMIRKRQAGVPLLRMHWPSNDLLTDSGRVHRNRAFAGYILFIALIAIGFLAGWQFTTGASR